MNVEEMTLVQKICAIPYLFIFVLIMQLGSKAIVGEIIEHYKRKKAKKAKETKEDE